MMTQYPHFKELGIAPDYLMIGSAAMRGLHDYGYFVKRPSDRPGGIQRQRVAHSPYVGVTLHRGRWIAQYGPRGKVKTRVYPMTAEGEKQAAIARAHALGIPYLEKRDGSREDIGGLV